MPTTLPSLGGLQTGNQKPSDSRPSDQGIVNLPNSGYGVSPDGRNFYVRDERNGRQGWRRLDPNDRGDQRIIEQAKKTLERIPRNEWKKILSGALKNASGKTVLEKAQREAGGVKSRTTKADELASKFGVPKPDANKNRSNNGSGLPEANEYAQDNLNDNQNLGQNPTDLDYSGLPKNQTTAPQGQPAQNNQADLGPDASSENQTKPPYQPKPDGGSQLPPLGSLRNDAYPKDSWADDENGTFPENRRAQEEPDEDRYQPQWREEEKDQERSEDYRGQSEESGSVSNRQATKGVSSSTPGGGNQPTNRSLGSRVAGYKDKVSRFAKNFGGSGQQGSSANTLGQAANKASQTLQKARQAAQTAQKAAQAAQKAAQTAKQAVQVAKGARVGVQLLRLILPLLVPLLKILLIVLIVIVLLLIIIAAVGSVLKPINDFISAAKDFWGDIFGTQLDKKVFDEYISYINGFDVKDPTNFKRSGEQRFSLLPRDNSKVQAVLKLISNDAGLRGRINRLLYEGLHIGTNYKSATSSELNVAEPSFSNRVILRISWMWVENDWADNPPGLGPDWYFYNCADRDGTSENGIYPKKYDLAVYCGLYGSGKHQVVGFQLGDRAKEGKIISAYNFCFKQEFPNGAGQVMQENLKYSSKATREAWKYNNPAYDGKMPFLSDLNKKFLITDFYTGSADSCISQECEARTQLLVKHPCMAMYLNTAADTWETYDGSRADYNAQVILSALHYYILDLKANSSR